MRLTTAGIVIDPWERVLSEEIPDQPEHVLDLLRHWHTTLDDIEPGCTFGDLTFQLGRIREIHVLSPLLGCDVPAFLREAERTVDDEHARPLEYVHVYNVAEPTSYREDPSQPDEPLEWLDDDQAAEQKRVDAGMAELTGGRTPRRVIDATGDDPMTGKPAMRRMRVPKLYGSWNPPYNLVREFSGWGPWEEPYDGYFSQHPEIDPARYQGAYSLALTPMSALVHLPLRYDPRVQFSSTHPADTRTVVFDTEVTVTLGDFLHAIFNEIGFHQSPDHRNEVWRSLEERLDSIRKQREDRHT